MLPWLTDIPRHIYENVLSIHFAEADTEEDLELLIFDRNTSTKLSKSDVLKVLKKANLTGHGFKKEVSYQTVKSDGRSTYFKASQLLFSLNWSPELSVLNHPFKTKPQNQSRINFFIFSETFFTFAWCGFIFISTIYILLCKIKIDMFQFSIFQFPIIHSVCPPNFA